LVHAITFDFWHTLFEPVNTGDTRRREIKDVLERAGAGAISQSRIDQAIALAWQEWDRVWEQECRTFGAEEWVALVLTALGVVLPQSEREALVHAAATSGMNARPPLVDGVDTLLPHLAQSYRLGLICDTGLSPGWMLREWMASQGILGYFSHLTFSDELGVSKPHPDAFLTTLSRLEVLPKEAVHIGDLPRTDIAGAKGVGMRAIRFTGVSDWGDGAVSADAEIVSYSELGDLLTDWSTQP
jgi:putative hydrolase of the HAD superfamily